MDQARSLWIRVARYLVRKYGGIDTVLSNVPSIQRPIYLLLFIMREEKLVKQHAYHVGICAWFQSVEPSEQIEDTFRLVKRGKGVLRGSCPMPSIFMTSRRAVWTYKVTRYQRQRTSYIVAFAMGEITFCSSREMKHGCGYWNKGSFLIGKSSLVESIGKETRMIRGVKRKAGG